MLNAVDNATARSSAVSAAARYALRHDPEGLALFTAVLTISRRDALLIADPKDWNKYSAVWTDNMKTYQEWREAVRRGEAQYRALSDFFPQFDRSRVYVYKQSDFYQEIDRVYDALIKVTQLRTALTLDHGGYDETRLKLFADPQIAQEIRKKSS